MTMQDLPHIAADALDTPSLAKLALPADSSHPPRILILYGSLRPQIEFFEALVADVGRKVFLILDNLGVHHCKPVKAWLATHVTEMEVFYLPSYSPELNPEERLNADLKHVIRRKVPARTKAKLRAATEEHMTVIGNEPERVKAYFHDPRVKYAA